MNENEKRKTKSLSFKVVVKEKPYKQTKKKTSEHHCHIEKINDFF